ncbi:MAG TPA: serine hydrolase domain-containing protein [Fimbriimonadaceae bacterium]|nr:serine hydrolase domain-containing protein [Fimbriimonadaceae bacterium]
MPTVALLFALVLAPSNDLAAQVDTKIKELHAAAEFPGATVAFVLPDGSAHEFAVGFADVEAKTAMRPSSRMFSGSIRKTWVAARALQLVGEGKLDLDAPISKYIGAKPYFDRIPNAKTLTTRHLLNHTSGIREHVLNPNFLETIRKDPDKTLTPDELADFALETAPLFEPGKGWSYADTNFNFVGLILEQITGKPFFDEADALFLKKLGLSRTSPSNSRRISDLAQGYSMPNSPFGLTGPLLKDGVYPFQPQMEYCGGGFVGNALDLAKWAKLLFEGKAYDAKYIGEATTGLKANTGPNEEYGLGVQIRPSEWGKTWGHSGWFPGYLSDMAYFPHKRFSVAVQFNTDHMAKIKRRPYAFLMEIARIVEKSIP